MRINPNALVFWTSFGIIGYLIGGTHVSLVFLAGALAISLLLAFV